MNTQYDSDQEMLNIYDDDKNHIGTATREDVHRYGYWHEAFHCWFVSREENTDYIYIQLRSEQKKDYPNLLDITAAGHLLANETVLDGVREVKEEIGIEVSPDELERLGIMDYCVEREGFIDKEMAHVYLYSYKQTFQDFILQKEEVSGVFKARFQDFDKLWTGAVDEITLIGFTEGGRKDLSEWQVQRQHFVPHEEGFYQKVIQLIRQSHSIRWNIQ